MLINLKRYQYLILNDGATYQRLVNKMFANFIDKTMDVYVDYIIVKSLKAIDHVSHLNETF